MKIKATGVRFKRAKEALAYINGDKTVKPLKPYSKQWRHAKFEIGTTNLDK